MTVAEETLTTAPPPASRNKGAIALVAIQTPLTLTLMTRSHSLSGMSSKPCRFNPA